MRQRSRVLPLLALAVLVPSAGWSVDPNQVDFSRDIRPILSEKCFQCHGPDEEHRKGKLRLDLKEDAFRERDGYPAFKAGSLEESESWYRITTDDEDDVMPPPKIKKPLTDGERTLIRKWIEQGAQWNSHWSFEVPVQAAVPTGAHPIDHFIAKGHRDKKLDYSPPADAPTLIRRLSLDLTGLPPGLAEVQAFEEAWKRDADGALAELVDRLLASRHFGERMATTWLDAARYGDTSVMHADGPRDMWAWRDWVVKAYNDNKPFNEFGIEQLAGDLLPDASIDQKVASGFNRNHATSDEGGAIAEELRVEYVADRVRTTANVFMGLTMECAQCHDHKYDPISNREYYRFFAYFNNHADPGMQTRNGNQNPVVHVVTPADGERLAQVRLERSEAEQARKKARDAGAAEFKTWIAEQPEAPASGKEPKGLKHLIAPESLRHGIAVDLVTRNVGVREGPDPGSPDQRGLSLNGTSTVTFPKFPDYDLHKKPFTMAAWIKAPANAGGAVFSDMDVDAKYRGWDLWMQGGSVGTHIINSWPKNAIKVVSKEKLKPDTWQHVVITYDGKGSADGVVIYIDGQPAENVVEQPKVSGSTRSGATFRIGARSKGGNFRGAVDDIRIYQRALSAEEAGVASQDPIATARASAPDKRSKEETAILTEYFHLTRNDAHRKALAAFHHAEREEKSLTEGKTTTMVMADNPADKMRQTYILDRGAYDAPKKEEVIPPGTPAVLPPIDEDAPANRLTLARWLFADEHPLTSRVTVNLLWQSFFGTGLVSTPGDFGAQGAYPTHPELLDWLAVDFRENGWDVKRLIRQIVTSRTYRQQSRTLPLHREADPANVLLARFPRTRLQAEFLRDNALAISGLLNRQFGGPGVKPYQPPGLWAQVGLGGNPKFVQDHDEKLYRRSLYTYWKRSAPAPSLQIFDAPTREICTMKRPTTNTPLQALVTLNDIQFVEAARTLAERMMKEGGDRPESRHAHAYRLATARPPNSVASATMKEVYDTALAQYEASPEAAKALLAVGESKRDESLPLAEHAANTVVASLILNLDETMTRE